MNRAERRRRRKKSGKANPPPAVNGAPEEQTLTIGDALDLAVEHHNAGRLTRAESIYQRILLGDPNQPMALHLLGVIAHQAGKNDLAVDLITRAIAVRPDCAEAHYNLGVSLQGLGKLEDAVASYQRTLAVKPDYAEAHANLGVTLQGLGELDGAVASFHRALAVKPDYAEAHSNLGNALKAQGKPDEAIASYQKALAIKPDYAEAHNNLGNALRQSGKLDDAVASYHQALAVKPDYAEAYSNLGIALLDLGKLEDAIAAYRECLRIEPDYETVAVNLLSQLRHACAWTDVAELEPKVGEFTRRSIREGGTVALRPFDSLTSNADGSENHAVAQAKCREIAKKMSALKTGFHASGGKSPRPGITIGYLSSDFRDHATAHLMSGLFGLHDRGDFNVFTFSHGQNDGSAYREKIINDSDRFIDIQTAGHSEAAGIIFESGVDILVDLNGHTRDNRLEICALRPAPVQAAFLGFPGTTGADFLDYIITDKIVTPEDQSAFYSEKPVYLPHCYLINDHMQRISEASFTRSDFGLPAEGFVFCSFNGNYKIEPVMFGVWMNLLKKVPGSVLWLLRSNDLAERNLKSEAEARGVTGDRLIFAEDMPKDRHLARYRLADLALDTRICGGHTTTSDALWAGVPVVTMLGAHFPSRIPASLLAAVGLEELVTHGLEDYEALALGLSRNPGELRELKAKLARNRLSEPLFDTPRFVANLERAYRRMWEKHLSGEAPSGIEVIEE